MTIISALGATSSRPAATIRELGAIITELAIINKERGAISAHRSTMRRRVGRAESKKRCAEGTPTIRNRLQAANAAQLADNIRKKEMFPEGGLIQHGKTITTTDAITTITTHTTAAGKNTKYTV